MKVLLMVLVMFPLFSFAEDPKSCMDDQDCKPGLQCKVFKCLEKGEIGSVVVYSQVQTPESIINRSEHFHLKD